MCGAPHHRLLLIITSLHTHSALEYCITQLATDSNFIWSLRELGNAGELGNASSLQVIFSGNQWYNTLSPPGIEGSEKDTFMSIVSDIILAILSSPEPIVDCFMFFYRQAQKLSPIINTEKYLPLSAVNVAELSCPYLCYSYPEGILKEMLSSKKKMFCHYWSQNCSLVALGANGCGGYLMESTPPRPLWFTLLKERCQSVCKHTNSPYNPGVANKFCPRGRIQFSMRSGCRTKQCVISSSSKCAKNLPLPIFPDCLALIPVVISMLDTGKKLCTCRSVISFTQF